jgi:hypothetical protein
MMEHEYDKFYTQQRQLFHYNNKPNDDHNDKVQIGAEISHYHPLLAPNNNQETTDTWDADRHEAVVGRCLWRTEGLILLP